MPLKTIQVGKYTVSEYSTLQNVRARMFSERVTPLRKVCKEGETLSDDDQAYNLWLDDWIGLAAITQPYISLDEYAEMQADVLIPLLKASDEVNGDLQEFAEQPKSKKKPSGKRLKSTNA
jgi:hypothetical protein